MQLPSSLVTQLGRPRIFAWATTLTILLTLPSLGTELVLNDHVQKLSVDNRLHLPTMMDSPFETFEFVPHNRALHRRQLEELNNIW